MNYFASSLGRRCNYCHVNNSGQWDYAADTKPGKNTAREMIKLVMDVNKGTFKGNPTVSCYTCHRGRNQPQGVPHFAIAAAFAAAKSKAAGPGASCTGRSAASIAEPTTLRVRRADEIFAKYADALGGQAAIGKLKTRTAKGTIVQANGNSLPFELISIRATCSTS